MKDLGIKKELAVLDKSKARQIEKVFAPMVAMLKGFEAEYEKVMAMDQTKEKSAVAKALRISISKVRINAEKVKTDTKKEYLLAGNAVQGVFNILKFAVNDKEVALKGVENYYAIIEAERISKIQRERESEIAKYGVDGSMIKLGEMDEAVWNNFLTGTKTNYEAVKAAEEETQRQAEIKKAEDDAEAERQKKILRDENAKMARENQRLKNQDAERQATEEAARELAEEAPDSEKLMGWANALEAKIQHLSAQFAKDAVKNAVEEMRLAAGVVSK